MPHGRILIVDDEADFLASLAEVFQEEGYQVETAANGRDAMTKMSGEQTPNVVILDMMMPVMSGGEVYAAMRSDPRLAKVPVIVSTSDPARAPEGCAVMPKPIKLTRMLEEVGKICAGCE